MKLFRLFITIFSLTGLLSLCSLVTPRTRSNQVQNDPMVQTSVAATLEYMQCEKSFDRHPVREPFSKTPHFTLSAEEFNSLLDSIGIASLCVPVQLGSPYVLFDYRAETLPTTKGRMVLINFEGEEDGTPWTRGQIVYSTYNFMAPTEYNIFSKTSDYEAVQGGKMGQIMQINNVTAFTRITRGIPMGTTTLFLTYVFPFADHYLAVIYDLGAYENDLDEMELKFTAADYPAEYWPAIRAYSRMMTSIEFK